MPPTLTHTEVNAAREAVTYTLDQRQRQLAALQNGDEDVLSILYAEEVVNCEDEDCNPDLAIAIKSMAGVIARLETLEASLLEVLRHCEKCGQKTGDVSRLYPYEIWLCSACEQLWEASE